MTLRQSQSMPAVADVPPAGLTPRRRRRFPGWLGAALALAALVTFTAIREPAFLKPINLFNVLEQNATTGIVAVGMTLVITLGGIDLSVGSLLALAGGLAILVMNKAFAVPVGGAQESWMPVLAAAAVAVAAGLAAGLLNGFIIAKGKVAPFIATLGALVAYRSVAMWIANGGQFFSDGSTRFAELGKGWAIPGSNISLNPNRIVRLELPWSVLVWAAIAVGAAVLLNRTRLGRYIIAVGSNERAAVYSAVAVDRVKIAAYACLGILTGVAALLNAANYTSVNSANAGALLELDAIAAVVIGGTRMEGGSGSIVGTVIGILLLGVIRNMMVMLQINPYAQGLVTGLIIVAAVLIQRLGARR